MTARLGLGVPGSWVVTVAVAAAWTVLMLAYSPLADRFARRWFPDPPNLAASRPVQQSWVKLAAGIVVAWLLGGFLEELLARGVAQQSIQTWLTPALPRAVAATVAVLVAATGAALAHFYQGRRAMLIVLQLSVLFGVLMIVSGHHLWTVIICHGLYDTVAFVRFARGTSRYAR